MEPFWEPLGAKVALDAVWTASGTPFGGLLGAILAPRWARMAPRWRYVGRLVASAGQLGTIFTNMFKHSGHLGIKLFSTFFENGESVKTNNAPSLLLDFSSPERVRPGLAWNGKSKKRNKYFLKAFPSHPKIDPKTYENRPQN